MRGATARRGKLAALLSSESTEWGTPRPFFRWLHLAFDFTIDVCASATNAKLRRYYDKKANGLARSWARETWWKNPPYGRQLPMWMGKAKFEAMNYEHTGGCSLVPARVDTDWWIGTTERELGQLRRSYYVQQTRTWWLVWRDLKVGIYHHDERLQFEGQPMEGESSPFPTSIIALLHPTWRPPTGRTIAERTWQGRLPLTLGMPL